MSALENVISAYIQQLAAQNLPNFKIAVMGVLQLLLSVEMSLFEDTMYPDYGPKVAQAKQLQFDIIIIGAGSAGSTLAGRLCEANFNVLVLEAGGNPQPCSEVPLLFPCMMRSYQDWQYISQDYNVCQANADGGCWTPRGKCVGGCSSMNVMFAIINSYCIFEMWEKIYGCKGWGTSDVLKYFKKLEGYVSNPTHSPYLGTKGPVTISNYWPDPFDDFLLKSGKQDGYRRIPDPNIGINTGFTLSHATIRDGRRCSASKAYIIPVKNRKNCKVIQNATVTELLFNKRNRVIGVSFILNDKSYKAYAKYEVISSAGAIGSPLLLMLSGIGPAAELAKNGIQVKKDLPVGKYLWDHLAYWLWFFFDPTSSDVSDLVTATADYLTNQTGPFAGIGTLNCVQFTVPINDKCDGKYGHIQSFPFYFQRNSYFLPVILGVLNYKPEVVKILTDKNADFDIMLTVSTLLDPHSNGEIKLNGTKGVDAFLKPWIKYNYLSDSDDYDLNSLIDGALDQISRLHTPAYKAKNGGLIQMNWCNEYWPKDNISFSRQYFKCLIKYFGNTVFHPVGTCRMGPKNKDTVVDADLNVHGVPGLRVCDASIMPYITASNTNVPTIMIAEKTADKVKETYMNCRQPDEFDSSSSSSSSSSECSSEMHGFE